MRRWSYFLINSIRRYFIKLELEIRILLLLLMFQYVGLLFFLSNVSKKMPVFTFFPIYHLILFSFIIIGIIYKKYWGWLLGIIWYGFCLLTNDIPRIISKVYWKHSLESSEIIGIVLKIIIVFFFIISEDLFDI